MFFFILIPLKQVVGQYKIWNEDYEVVFWRTQVYPIHVIQCLHAIVDTMPVIRIPQILVFKVIRYHHELACTLNSVVFELSFCLLFLKSIMMTLWVRSFGVIWIMISDPRSLTWFIKGTDESMAREDSSVPLMHQWSWNTNPDPDNNNNIFKLKFRDSLFIDIVGMFAINWSCIFLFFHLYTLLARGLISFNNRS